MGEGQATRVLACEWIQYTRRGVMKILAVLRNAAMRRECHGPISYAMRCDEEMWVVSLVAVCGVGDGARQRQSRSIGTVQHLPEAPVPPGPKRLIRGSP